MTQKIIKNFKLLNVRELTELNGELWELEHVRSGARALWLKREDDNMTFGIGFRTLPEDDTGVFHILEHSVLCGSEKYPVKEPFVDLLKSSMQTFLNAMTFPDKTVYPISSRNEQDYINLMRVYLDAVFKPLIYKKPEIFYQEGWHYELESEGAEPVYKGVVFNEMKGAFSNPDTLMQNEIFRRLFPDNCYRFVSGGDPQHIPDLTYEGFLNSHRRFYHPSNSYIFLDGSIDLEKILGIIDEEYLSGYERLSGLPEFELQKPVDGGKVTIKYEASSEEELKNRAKLSWSFVFGDYNDIEDDMAVSVLADTLCGSNQSPLKKKLLSSGLASDLSIRLLDGILQPYVVMQADDLDEAREGEVEKLVFDELARIAREGLDHDQIAATLANMEFQMRERDFGSMPRGLVFGLNIFDTWLYGGDPAVKLEVGGLFASLNKKLNEGYFEKVLERVFLKSSHKCAVLLVPSLTLGEERRAAESQRLKKESAAWSAQGRAELWRAQQALTEWQSREDSPEDKATIPMLRLSDISKDPDNIPVRQDTVAGVPALFHDIDSGGISYVNLYFDITDFDEDKIYSASLLSDLISGLDTEKHDNLELQRLARLKLGNSSIAIDTLGKYGDPDSARAFFTVSYSATDANLRQGSDLICEILTLTRLNDREKIRDLLRQFVTELEQRVITSGHVIANTRLAAGCSVEGVMREYAGGFSYCRRTKDLSAEFETRADALINEFKSILSTLLTRARLTVSVTGTNRDAGAIIAETIVSRLPEGEKKELRSPVKPWGIRREGIAIPSDVCYAGLGGNIIRAGGKYNGALRVLSRTVSLAYLWNAVRVQGGAYGTGMITSDIGNIAFYSYRDPQAARSLGCYRRSCEFLTQFCEAAPDMTGLIIGAVSDSDPLLLPRMRGKLADSLYFKGISYEDRSAMRRELLGTDADAVKALIPSIRAFTEGSGVCVVGPRKLLEDCGADIENIYTI